MTPDRTELLRVAARVRLHRDLIAWLVACIAKQESDPDQMLKVVSEFMSAKIDGLPNQEAAEAMRAELDAIISDARRGI